jgi:endonuclease-3 related protein
MPLERIEADMGRLRNSGGSPSDIINEVYDSLLSSYGKQGWWPVTIKAGGEPEYLGGPRSVAERFEVAVGAVLTQNTSWKNAAAAVSSLSGARMLEPEKLASVSCDDVARLIRSSGYYNQKAKRLITLARFFVENGDCTPDRASLLALKGVGPETADSILLYAFSVPFFVVDAYTRRLFSRLGVIRGNESYDRIRDLFESSLERSPEIFNEYHALVVEHCKRSCLRTPRCSCCPLSALCTSESHHGGG